MYLRELNEKDAPLMLEWMHDERVVENLKGNFLKKTIEDCLAFIADSKINKENIHLAICSNEDEYMGTVSLKNVDSVDKSAEFAITVRNVSMGKGYAWFGMEEMIRKGFNEFGLESIYWCVSLDNKRAVRFYDKHQFNEVIDMPKKILDRYFGVSNLKWYSLLKGDILEKRELIAGCKVVKIKTIPTVNAGELSFFEVNRNIDFEIKRIYYISKVPEGIRRGFHAHKNLKQILFCPFGRIQLILENELGREEIELSDPSIAVVIDRLTWREMLWLQKDSVLCVAASDYYSETDYIRNYEEFLAMINIKKQIK